MGPSLEQFLWLMRSEMPSTAEWNTRFPRQDLAVLWVQAEYARRALQNSTSKPSRAGVRWEVSETKSVVHFWMRH